MQNNLTQQTPYYYGYGIPQMYQRPAPMQMEAPQAQATPQYMMPQNLIKGRPVVSIDEARAAQIDLDGSLYVFPDIGNKKIYTKQINLDGTATFNVFELAPQAVLSAEERQEYVTKTQLDAILAEFKESLVQVKNPKPASAPLNFNI